MKILRGLWLLAFSGHALMNMVQAADTVVLNPVELPTRLTVGYAVRAIDINADQRLDIAIVDSKRVLWLENPNWTEHVIYETPQAKFDNVCFAPRDINGDGRIDLALGADWQFGNTNSGGSIGWLEHTAQGPWRYHSISQEPTTHRMLWIDWLGESRPELIVAPLKGRGTKDPGFDQVGVRLLAFEPGKNPVEETWGRRVLTEQLHVMHNLDVTDLDADGKSDLITASYEGVNWVRLDSSGTPVLKRLGVGQDQPAPKRGCSEIRLGTLRGGRKYIATIEPWHGDKVVVYVQPDNWNSREDLWSRTVLDVELAWGHALACANLDNDPDQELIVGIRDNLSESHRCGVRIYDPVDALAGTWNRQIVDPGAVAVEDLVSADFDADGDNDIVAVGRATHNVKLYINSAR